VRNNTPKGCRQGSPLSPILSNIVLNELDHELEQKKLIYCRWADDFVILLKSEEKAEQVMEEVILYLEKVLCLPVNREKSRVIQASEIVFLGFKISQGRIQASDEAIEKFEKKVRKLKNKDNSLLADYVRGWENYFKFDCNN